MTTNTFVFVAIFLAVAFNYRLAADDYHHASLVRSLGVWDTMAFYYDNWNPRWSSILVTNIFLSDTSKTWSLFLFHCCSLLLSFVAIYSFISALSRKLLLPFSPLQLGIAAMYLVMAAFYISFSKDDTWFWITVNPMYLWGTFAAVLGGSLLIQTWLPRLRQLLVALLFIYVGGSSESAAISSLIVLIFIGFTFRNSKNRMLDSTALHIATMACMIGFGISVTGQGIQVRREHLPHYPISDRLLVGLWNYIKFNLLEIPKVLPIAVLAVTPFGFFGRKHLRFQLISLKDVFWANRKMWILSDLVIALLSISIGFVMCEMGPERTWFPITILVLTVSVALSYQLGSWVYIVSKGKLFLLVILSQLILLGYQSVNGVIAIRQAIAYSSDVDQRMLSIKDQLDTKSAITVSPLSDSGWLLSSEISSDSTHFTNKHLGLFFDTDQAIVLDSTLTSKK